MLYNIASRILKYFYTNEIIILYENREKDKCVTLAEIEILIATYENLDDLLYFQDKKYIDKFKIFLNNGDTGYIAYIEGNCIHRCWVKSNNEIVNFHWALPYRLKNDEIFIHYCETSLEARGKNVYPSVLSRIIKDRDKKVLLAINKKNIASRRGCEKVGFHAIKEYKIFVILFIKFIKGIDI